MALTDGQRKCVETLDRPLVVAAGAGSGKTYTLTQRIAGALASGFVSDIQEVCAITFTTKAAAELKARIKSELRARGLVDQALRVDEAWISTIHGMCARILRSHAIELGIDPSFAVAEGAAAQDLLDQAVDAVLVESQVQDSPRLDSLFREYPARSSGGFGVSVEGMLKELVGLASSQANGAASFVMPGATLAPSLVVSQAIEVVESALVAAEQEKPSAKRDEWMASAEQALQRARDSQEGGVADYEEALRIVAPFKLAKTFGGKEYKARVDEARGLLGACVMEARLGLARSHLDTLVELSSRVLEVFSELKRAGGVLDNNDLLVLAADAIETHPDIAARYCDKFKLVMVDEFQDTDQMQVDMIKRLSGPGACRLCTVGDAQQSIYRFRGADVSVYRRHLDSVRAQWPDSIIELSQNFRSSPDVLAFVDCVFEKPGMFGGEFMSLGAGRDESRVAAPFVSEAPRIVVQHTTRPSRGVSGASATEVSARRIADTFASYAREGHSLNEMVVLLGRMTNAGVYAKALRDEGLPCVVAGGSVFSRTLEARVMVELTRVVANPRETQSLLNVLTSPLFALTAGDLLSVGGLEGFWRVALSPSEERGALSVQLACALEVMRDVRGLVGRVPVSRIVEKVVRDSGWLSRLECQGAEGLASAGNVYKAIRMMRDIEESDALGPASVARRFAETVENSKEAPGALSVSGSDSVRIMTIHASKGLEFPIVAVAEVKEDRAPASRLLATSLDGSVYVSLDLGRTLDSVGDTVDSSVMERVRDYVLGLCAGEEELARAVADDGGALQRRLALREYIAVGDAEEAKRLLYVAITRAKEALVVSCAGMRTKDNPGGVPKSALAGVFDALDPSGLAAVEGQSACEYGGSSPAILEIVSLSADDEGEQSVSVASEGEAIGDFMVPVVDPPLQLACEPYRSSREGVFSYSSVSESSHEGDLLERLAESYSVSVDGALGEGLVSERNSDDGGASSGLPASFDDAFWDFGLPSASDEDRATSLGTAFHRLAQFAVVTRGEDGALLMPDDKRIDALCRACGLDSGQRARLTAALKRWFGSDVAGGLPAFAHVAAEVPFFVTVPMDGDCPAAYLEGEIDLLALDEAREHAVVVDYKTGGTCEEPEAELRRKHVLQACCYAYAVMLQGIDRVDAVFVRVEQPRVDDPAEPQCVRYRFESSDIPALGAAVATAYKLAGK